MRHRRNVSLMISILATLTLAFSLSTVVAPPSARAAVTPNGVYMIDRIINPGLPSSSFEVRLASVTVAGGQMGVTVIYRNVTSAPMTLSCAPLQRSSITMNGAVFTESSSYCSTHPGRQINVPAGGKFPSWAKFNVVPEIPTPFTLNSWWGLGEVRDIQLIPFACIVGPGGSCQGLPRSVPVNLMPTPSRWITSPATAACVLSVVAQSVPQIKLLNIWIAGLGGVVRAQNATKPVDKVFIIVTTVMKAALPFGGCADLGILLGIQGLKAVAPSLVPVVSKYARLVLTT